jgi:hypothetical protein
MKDATMMTDVERDEWQSQIHDMAFDYVGTATITLLSLVRDKKAWDALSWGSQIKVLKTAEMLEECRRVLYDGIEFEHVLVTRSPKVTVLP